MRPRTYQCVFLLMCAVACIQMSESIAVNATQRQIMDDLVAEWPVLARLKEGAWTPLGMDQACNRSRIAAYGVRCDDTGWVLGLDWSGLREKMQNKSEVLGLCSTNALSRFSNLKVLIFHDTGLYGTLPASWSLLANLQTLIIEDEPYLGNSTIRPPGNTNLTSIPHVPPSSASLDQDIRLKRISTDPEIGKTDSNEDDEQVEGRLDRHQSFETKIANLQTSTAHSDKKANESSSSSEGSITETLSRYPTTSKEPAIPSSWSKLRNLVTVRLVRLPSLECQIPPAIHQFWPLLKSIQIVGTRCNGFLDSSLFWSPLALKNASFSDNRFSGSLPPIVAHANMTFETLDVSWNFFSGTIPQTWERAPPRRLSLSGNLFSGSLPSRIGPSFEVEDNSTSTNKTKITPKSAKLVDFSKNMFTGTLPQSLLDSWITELVVDYNQVSGPLVLPRDGKNLKRLSIKENLLSGPLPASLWNASRLQYLDASRNSLAGPFPDTPDDVEATAPDNDDDDPDPDEDSLLESFMIAAVNAIGKLFGWPEEDTPAKPEIDVQDSTFLQISPDTSLSAPATCYLKGIDLSHNPLNARLPESLGACSLSLARLEMANSSLVGTVHHKFVDVNLDLNIQWSPIFGPNATFNLEPLFSPLRYVDLSGNRLIGPLPYFFEYIDETDMYPTGTLELRVQDNRFDSDLHGAYFNKSIYFRYFNISNNRLKLCDERGSTYRLKFQVCDASAQFPSPCGCPSLWYPKCLHKEMRDTCITPSQKMTHSAILGATMLVAFTYLAFKELSWMQYR